MPTAISIHGRTSDIKSKRKEGGERKEKREDLHQLFQFLDRSQNAYTSTYLLPHIFFCRPAAPVVTCAVLPGKLSRKSWGIAVFD